MFPIAKGGGLLVPAALAALSGGIAAVVSANTTAAADSSAPAEDEQSTTGWFWDLVGQASETISTNRALTMLGGAAVVAGGIAYMSETAADEGIEFSKEEVECARASALACKSTVRQMEETVSMKRCLSAWIQRAMRYIWAPLSGVQHSAFLDLSLDQCCCIGWLTLPCCSVCCTLFGAEGGS
eukprot:TRINITY_DN15746_c0_g1_i1.p1 TRINITY_DN15746_c0_g1~~TRINITY_DN15746_c0_g1_i1.p1  ORF type:complete len:183 (-),score=31.44 TRINITY_DN15746_c0_g1_i1:539-1087(-)